MPHSPAVEHREFLSGLIERVTYHNPENGYCVLRVKARGHRDLVTLIGHAASIQPGEWAQASGNWEVHREHGQQFRATHLKTAQPTSLEGIEKYLGSGLIKGIGPVYARKLVKAFGEAVFDIIEQDPSRLSEVTGIGPKRAAKITSAWADQKAIREIMVFLQSHGVGTSRAVRIFKTYGVDAIALVTENPYRLARDIRGIGFKTADMIAEKLGIPQDAMIRARAGISYTLLEAVDDGHCGLPRDDLLTTAEKLLEIPVAILEDAIRLELDDGVVVADQVADQDCVFLRRLWEAERVIAGRVALLREGEPPWPSVDADKAIPWVEGKLGVSLAASQKDAVRMALASKLMVITGGPGVGKTTLVNSILKILAAKGVHVLLAAPTGRAAKRMTEATGMEAKTIHRLLEFDPTTGGFRRNEEMPLQCNLLVLDETSMVDVPLMASVLRAVPAKAAVILVGDVDQLPSVGPGQVLADTIESEAVPVVRLTEVFRQAATSQIITNAHRINAGQMPVLTPPKDGETTDFYFVDTADAEDAVRKVVEIVQHRIPRRFGFDPIRDIQILTPMNRGGLGARTLNLALQAALNPAVDQPAVERFGWTYRPGDKVMQVENDYDKEVYNGDLGLVTAIDPDAQQVVINFDGRDVVYIFGELDEVSLAFATTIHKSQGSEYPAVVIPIGMPHFMMLKRNLIYTGVTRGKKLVVLVGQRRAVGLAVRTAEDGRRWSKLREILKKPVPVKNQAGTWLTS
ncbi:recombinase RecD [Azospirillum thiophilum]|uniref:ATP-dependent RecD2 DNA helicase n=2 Tax=Azospirillum thiophilum TaxID=528244 RepID=A0AAC8VVK4_9PROT|nr:ATP-dependent RecD-like DNA helicase [Azospirillum thiophilum]ALG70098.1 recombinase RecD [Azospirillum thiophilum]KJR67252.1 recombinase RecD [Azospirillum thiophilum]